MAACGKPASHDPPAVSFKTPGGPPRPGTPVDLPLALPELSQFPVVDSIVVADADRFWEKWPMVTVRYRADNQEMRYIYANPVAYEAMRQHRREYPDGAMFAKVAFRLGQDPAFSNSAQPSRFTRIQLMRKNRRLYPKTSGWGYALVIARDPRSRSLTTNNSPEAITACHACHTMVPERDYVFARPTFLGDGYTPPADTVHTFERTFIPAAAADWTMYQRRVFAILRAGDPGVDLSTVNIRAMDLFAGSVVESVNVLAGFAAQSRRAYALIDEPHGFFLVVAPRPSSTCPDQVALLETVGPGMRGAAVVDSTAFAQHTRVRLGRMCPGHAAVFRPDLPDSLAPSPARR